MKKLSLFAKIQISSIIPFIFILTYFGLQNFKSNREMIILSTVVLMIIPAIYFLVKKRFSYPLLSILHALQSRVDSLNASADQISDTAHFISTGVKEQYRGLSVAKEVIDEVSGIVVENEQNACNASDKTSEFVKISLNGMGSIENLNNSFIEIKSGNEEMLRTIEKSQKDQEKIAQMVQEIGNKTKIINEIVFQTKLLSFNASVEAARAGEHGKGFAVVAEEVGKLAMMTQTAALEISLIVNENKTAVETIISETSKSIAVVSTRMKQNISASSTQVEACSKLFVQISDESKDLDKNVQSILHSSEKQKQGFEEMSNAFNGLIDSVKQNALLGQQAEKAAILVNNENKGLGNNINDLMLFIFAQNESTKTNALTALNWDSKFLLMVPEMDEEHQNIVKIINQFIILINKNQTEEMIACIDNLLKVATEHFANEEKFMRDINYPDYSSHKRIHEALLSKLGEHRKLLGSKDFDPSRFIRFVQNWLLSHILGVDMQYSQYYADNKGQFKKGA